MKREGWLFFIPLLLLAFPTSIRAPAWSGIIDPSRAIDWSATGVGATIVNQTAQCGPTIAAYSSTADAINNALKSCNNGYVLLGPGTFTLSTGINFGAHNNVTLRGSGPTQTVINFTGGDSCNGLGGDICALNSTGIWVGDPRVQYGSGSNTAYWTAGFAQGTTQITLSTTSGLSVGMTLFLDQQDDSQDTGGVWVCQTEGVCSESAGGGQGRSGRGQIEMKQITAIGGNVVTISPGLYNTNWRAAQNPGAWWVGPMLTGVGTEDLTINHSGAGTTINSGIYFFDCQSCWVKNVRSLYANRNHVWCYLSSKITVRDSYFFGTLHAASESYGFEGFGCADALIEDNIFQHVTTPVQLDTTTGSVAAYNYNVDDYYTVSTGWQQAGQYEHATGTSFNLFEGNEGDGYNGDDIHGTHNQGTVFRNWYTGLDIICYNNQPCTQQTVPVIMQTATRGYNVIGNVLGTPGYHTNYEDRPDMGTTTTPNHTVYVLGWCANVGSISLISCLVPVGSIPNDNLTPQTLFRWGNYDTATGTVRWVSSEVPTTGVPYMNRNPVPASHTLPASFYLTSKPSWWGLMPWPAIGPDVTGGTGPGGFAFDIPAAVCYNATSKDGNGILLFDANVCYQPLRRLPPIFLMWDSGPNFRIASDREDVHGQAILSCWPWLILCSGD